MRRPSAKDSLWVVTLELIRGRGKIGEGRAEGAPSVHAEMMGKQAGAKSLHIPDAGINPPPFREHPGLGSPGKGGSGTGTFAPSSGVSAAFNELSRCSLQTPAMWWALLLLLPFCDSAMTWQWQAPGLCFPALLQQGPEGGRAEGVQLHREYRPRMAPSRRV